MTAIIGDNTHDLQLYYNESFLKIRENGSWVWNHITAPQIDRSGPQTLLFRAVTHLKDLHVIKIARDAVDVDTGQARYYFDGKESFFLRRHPVRESARAMTRHNTKFVNPLHSVIPDNFKGSLTQINSCHSYLLLLNSPDIRFTLNEGMEFLNKGQRDRFPVISIPLLPDDNKWCLSLAFDSSRAYDLWYGLTKVGEIGKDTRLFFPLEQEFTQEVRDSFPELSVVV